MLDLLLADIAINEEEEISVLVNSLGATPLEELFIIYRKVYEILNMK